MATTERVERTGTADDAESGATTGWTIESILALRRPGLHVELDERQKLACALRILAYEGCNLHVAGHITVVIDEAGNMLCNPQGMVWEEVRASDLSIVSPEGRVVAGDYDVSPAVFIHTEVHRARPDATVAVHNHGHYATLLGMIGEVPVVADQGACLLQDDVALFDEYGGSVDDESGGAHLARGVGAANAVLLANHGALVLGPTIEIATFKARSFEQMCRMHYDLLAAGRAPKPVDPATARCIQPFMAGVSAQIYWEASVRQLLAREPEVLD